MKMQGSLDYPYWDDTAVRWELWCDGIKLIVRIYRPKPSKWPGRSRLMHFDYPICDVKEKDNEAKTT